MISIKSTFALALGFTFLLEGCSPSRLQRPTISPKPKNEDGRTPSDTKTPKTNDTNSSNTTENSTNKDNQGQPKPEIDVVAELTAYLAKNSFKDIEKQSFATQSLNKDVAAKVEILLWDEYKKQEVPARQKEIDTKVATARGVTMKYETRVFGQKPAKGRSLYISLHGGGMTSPQENDQQWRNQIDLYKPAEGIYLAPRAPSDSWDLWHRDPLDDLYDRIISNYILTGEVDPDRVYIMGYSAGGDGLYQVAPRMADRFAAASMSAGHPGDASPLGLRNIGFAIHCGADDSAYNRNSLAAEWGRKLDDLQKANPGSYEHQVGIVAGKGHWMDLVDAESVPWMGKFTRNPQPKKISWHQDDILHSRFYWLSVERTEKDRELTAEIKDQKIELSGNVSGKIHIRLNDGMLDLSKSVEVVLNGKSKTFMPERNLMTVLTTIQERADPRSIFSAEIIVE